MPTPNLIEKLALRIEPLRDIIYYLIWISVAGIGLGAWLSPGSHIVGWGNLIVGLSIYILLWCFALIFVSEGYGPLDNEKKSAIRKFSEFAFGFSGGMDSGVSKWYGSIFLSVFVFLLVIIPLFGIFMIFHERS